jgi:hypothetical protein
MKQIILRKSEKLHNFALGNKCKIYVKCAINRRTTL